MIDPITLSLAVWYPAMFLLKPDVVNTAENIAKEESEKLRGICHNLLSKIEQKEQSLATLIKQLQQLPEGNCHSWGVLQVQETVNNYHEVADFFNELKELINSQKPIISEYNKVAEKIGVHIVGDHAEINIENLIAGTQGCSLLELSQLLAKMKITNETLLSKRDEFNTSSIKNNEKEVSSFQTAEERSEDDDDFSLYYNPLEDPENFTPFKEDTSLIFTQLEIPKSMFKTKQNSNQQPKTNSDVREETPEFLDINIDNNREQTG